ncbi:hypothetical protein [Streptomyces sp. NPDC006510]|uniref:hypothetical protein n=1 Tax=Streptomyces sp. NPDC006510 TaxID=3155600 RepID=UPI0033B041DA
MQAGKPHPLPSKEWFDELLAGFARVLSAELTELAHTRPTVTFTRINATHARVQEAPEPVSEFVRALPS